MFPSLPAEIASRRVGDIVEAGLLISNSEVEALKAVETIACRIGRADQADVAALD